MVARVFWEDLARVRISVPRLTNEGKADERQSGGTEHSSANVQTECANLKYDQNNTRQNFHRRA